MIRVLIYMNPLVVDKIGKTFQYWKDSGFIYAKQLIQSLPEDWRFYWVIPDKINEYAWFFEANKNVEIVPYPYSTSIHQNRYNFSIPTLNKYFPYGKDIDVVLCNQPEVSANIVTWCENQRREKPIVLSFYHWIDCKESSSFGSGLSGYIYREIDGAEMSDYILFHNEYAYNLFKTAADELIKNKDFSDKVLYFHPAQYSRLPSVFKLPVPDDKKIVLFNHRLNATTRWKEVVDVFDLIYKDRQDFVLWITDDSKTKEFEYMRERPYIIMQNLRDGEYGYLMRQAHFSVCNHRGYSTWNMAVIDSLINGCLVLMPNREVYQDMFKNSIKQFGERFTHDGNLYDQVIRLLNNSVENNRLLARKITETDSDIFNFTDGSMVEEIIYNEITKRVRSVPAKYDEVVNYIKAQGRCFKKDFINTFWSFHANSNFQKIRWKLLSENDIYDDTAFSETVYYYGTGGAIKSESEQGLLF